VGRDGKKRRGVLHPLSRAQDDGACGRVRLREFNAFFTTKEHGTGIGLRISRTIIEAHGGRLWITDNHPRGASFHFTLAVSSDAASLDASPGRLDAG
jgi:K+-sensing histidine kinase KdpD